MEAGWISPHGRARSAAASGRVGIALARRSCQWAIAAACTALAVVPLVASPAAAQGSNGGAGILYATDANRGNLITVNPSDGVGTVVGSILGQASSIPSLAIDAATGAAYGGGGSGQPILVNLDLVTGSAISTVDTGLGVASISGMDFSANGTLYAAVNIAGGQGTGSDHLATIDVTTGEALVIGPFGICDPSPIPIPADGSGSCTVEGIEGIAFAPDGTLYGTLSTRGAAGAPGLYTIDPSTGAATFVSPILDQTNTPPSGGIVSLEFACGGTLYGGTARSVGVPDGGFLVTIDPSNGRFSFVGTVSATDPSAPDTAPSLASLAFGSECPVVPDTDGDGVLDDVDNCVFVANPNQVDSDGDLCGNRCDADYNQDGVVSMVDFGIFSECFTGAVQDICDHSPEILDGLISILDFGSFGKRFVAGVPGPGQSDACNGQ